MSASNGGISWGRSCTMVTSRPSSRRFSASSSPMKPPPARTAERGLCRSTNALMRSVSSTVRSVNSVSQPSPGNGGCVGFAPGESTSLS